MVSAHHRPFVLSIGNTTKSLDPPPYYGLLLPAAEESREQLAGNSLQARLQALAVNFKILVHQYFLLAQTTYLMLVGTFVSCCT